MICDTTFVSHFLRKQAAREMGCARRFAALKLDPLPLTPRYCGDRRRVKTIGRPA